MGSMMRNDSVHCYPVRTTPNRLAGCRSPALELALIAEHQNVWYRRGRQEAHSIHLQRMEPQETSRALDLETGGLHIPDAARSVEHRANQSCPAI